jgi:hypothetical protein
MRLRRSAGAIGLTLSLLAAAIGDKMYLLGPDGNLAPTRPGQPAPDLRYFPR